MRIGFCIAAFAIGCLFAVLIRSNGKSEIAELPETISTSNSPVEGSSVPEQQPITELAVTSAPYATTADGQTISTFTCRNRNGYFFEAIEYGATIIAVHAPDRDGLIQNIVLNCEGLDGYKACQSYFGAVAGRYCNRISAGTFSIDGQAHSLTVNSPPNHLHGGSVGFDKKIWSTEEIVDGESVGVRMSLTSIDGEEGYPGNIEVSVTYLLNNQNELSVEFQATTDAATPVNLTNHAYWNLNGDGKGLVGDHQMQIFADHYLPTDDTSIPTGEFARVRDTRFDFRQAKPLQPQSANAPTHPLGSNEQARPAFEEALAATLSCPLSGRKMEVLTTQPGLHLYTANFLDGQPGSGGFDKHAGLCLETQHFPDSPNQPTFPSTILRPGETFKQTTVFRFSVDSSQ
ncbi:UNVERIFIED_CONTAM: hypothetical protein GTU68_007580 [Idotea baltica]|nr:hypothetical protein [Idotea baltica]